MFYGMQSCLEMEYFIAMSFAVQQLYKSVKYEVYISIKYKSIQRKIFFESDCEKPFSGSNIESSELFKQQSVCIKNKT